jgi:hypothetical protein
MTMFDHGLAGKVPVQGTIEESGQWQSLWILEPVCRWQNNAGRAIREYVPIKEMGNPAAYFSYDRQAALRLTGKSNLDMVHVKNLCSIEHRERPIYNGGISIDPDLEFRSPYGHISHYLRECSRGNAIPWRVSHGPKA